MAKKGKQKLDRTDARAPAGPRYVPHFPAAAEVVIFDRSCTTALGWSG